MQQRTASKFRERGMAVIVTAITLLFLVPLVGLAIDGGLAFIVKARMGAALDSAALAAGRGLTTGTTQSAAASAATTAALNFFSANFPPGYLNTSYVSQTACGGSGESACSGTPSGGYETCNAEVCATFTPNSVGTLSITVTATISSPTYFMKWIGVNSLPVSAVGQATRPNLVIALVLDTSYSMGPGRNTSGMPTSINYTTDTSCDAIVYNAWQFVQNFSAFDTVGLVTFDSQVSLAYAPSTNFKQTGSGSMEQALGNISCGSNTNTPAALAMAASVLNYVNQPQALNHIVIFTDGVANGVNSSAFPLRTSALVGGATDYRMSPGTARSGDSNPTPRAGTSGSCGDTSGQTLCDMASCVTSGTTMQGILGQGNGFSTAGGNVSLQQAFATNYPYTGTVGSGDASPSLPSGCASWSAAIAYIPTTDRFGNSTSGLWNNVVEQVNPSTAPSNAPMSPQNLSTPPGTKNLTGLWSSYTTVGTNTAFPGQNPSNTFPSGPFSGYFRNDLNNTIGIVSLNTAYNEAKQIQSNASSGTNPSNYSNPTSKYSVTIDAIYLQGNETDPIEPYFLEYVSNQQNLQVPSCVYTATVYPYTPTYTSNPNFVSSQPSGQYVAVSSSSQMSTAFEQIAGSLLRVTQ